MENYIISALRQLDEGNNEQWTTTGIPMLSAVRALSGNPNLTREDIDSVATGFTRSARVLPSGDVGSVSGTALDGVDADQVELAGSTEVSVSNDLAAQLAVQSAKVEMLRQAKDKASVEFDAARRAEDALRVQMDAKVAKHGGQASITAYLAAQQERIAGRAERQKLVQQAGIDLKALAAGLKSPIDMAMARKTGFGTKRPGT